MNSSYDKPCIILFTSFLYVLGMAVPVHTSIEESNKNGNKNGGKEESLRSFYQHHGREARTTENSNERANDCALQHIKTFREQALKGTIADFGEPCQNCIHRDICKFDWFYILLPLRSRSNVKINVVVPASSQQLDNTQCETARDMDTHSRMDKKKRRSKEE